MKIYGSEYAEALDSPSGRIVTHTPTGEEVTYGRHGHPVSKTGNNGTLRWCDQVGDWCAGHDCFCETVLFS